MHIPVDVVDLLFESLVEHLVGFVEHQHLDTPSPQGPEQIIVKSSYISNSIRDKNRLMNRGIGLYIYIY